MSCALQVIYTFGGVIIVDTSVLRSQRLPCTVLWISDKESANWAVAFLHNANVTGTCYICQICQVTHSDMCPVQPFLLMATSYTSKGEPCCSHIGLTTQCMPWALDGEPRKQCYTLLGVAIPIRSHSYPSLWSAYALRVHGHSITLRLGARSCCLP